jgi:lactate permease
VRVLLALAPLLAIVVLMLGCSWSAARAGAVTSVGALAIGLGVFGRHDTATVPAAAGIAAEAGFITLTIVGIIGPALGLHLMQLHTGATEHVRQILVSLHPDPRVGAVAVAWFFTLFLEGAAGFGTPIALAAPLLVTAGVPPVTALVAALAGHASGVAFGAVGTPVVAQSSVVGIPSADLAAATVWFPVVVGWMLLAAVIMALRDGRGGLWAWGLGAGVAFFVPFAAIAMVLGPELATLGGAVLGFGAWALVVRRHRGATHVLSPGASARAVAPYVWLIAAVLVARLWPPLRSVVERSTLEWNVDGFGGRVRILDHPALLLAGAFVVAAVVQRSSVGTAWSRAREATIRVLPVAAAVFVMVLIARTMTQTGMTVELGAAAGGAGSMWPWFAPAVGALGTFVTGSATASNLLFSELQLEAATRAALPGVTVLGAQGFGAAVGNIACPHNIIAGAATVGVQGAEAQVMRRTVPLAMACVVVAGAVAMVFVRW